MNEGMTKLSDQRAEEKQVMFTVARMLDTVTKTERMSFLTFFD